MPRSRARWLSVPPGTVIRGTPRSAAIAAAALNVPSPPAAPIVEKAGTAQDWPARSISSSSSTTSAAGRAAQEVIGGGRGPRRPGGRVDDDAHAGAVGQRCARTVDDLQRSRHHTVGPGRDGPAHPAGGPSHATGNHDPTHPTDLPPSSRRQPTVSRMASMAEYSGSSPRVALGLVGVDDDGVAHGLGPAGDLVGDGEAGDAAHHPLQQPEPTVTGRRPSSRATSAPVRMPWAAML